MAVDPYGYEVPDAVRPMGLLARWGVTLVWLAVDLIVLVCSGSFTALAWTNPEDPQYIALFSSPFWGFAAAGTLTGFALGVGRVHPALQILGSLLLSLIGGGCLSCAWFGGWAAITS